MYCYYIEIKDKPRGYWKRKHQQWKDRGNIKYTEQWLCDQKKQIEDKTLLTLAEIEEVKQQVKSDTFQEEDDQQAEFRDWLTIHILLYNLVRWSVPWLLILQLVPKDQGDQGCVCGWVASTCPKNHGSQAWIYWWGQQGIETPVCPELQGPLFLSDCQGTMLVFPWLTLMLIAGGSSTWRQMYQHQQWIVGTWKIICPTIPGKGRARSMPKLLRSPQWELSWTRL